MGISLRAKRRMFNTGKRDPLEIKGPKPKISIILIYREKEKERGLQCTNWRRRDSWSWEDGLYSERRRPAKSSRVSLRITASGSKLRSIKASTIRTVAQYGPSISPPRIPLPNALFLSLSLYTIMKCLTILSLWPPLVQLLIRRSLFQCPQSHIVGILSDLFFF